MQSLIIIIPHFNRGGALTESICICRGYILQKNRHYSLFLINAYGVYVKRKTDIKFTYIETFYIFATYYR